MNTAEVERRLRAAGLPTKPVTYEPSEHRKAISISWPLASPGASTARRPRVARCKNCKEPTTELIAGLCLTCDEVVTSYSSDFAVIGAGVQPGEPTFPGARLADSTVTGDIREWAIGEGLRCARKGPIPRATRIAYSEAHCG